LVVLVLAALEIGLFRLAKTNEWPVVSAFFVLVSVVLLAHLALAAKGRRFTHLPVAPGRVIAIIPAYNEDQNLLFECIEAILNGSVSPDKIIVVDDGSKIPLIPYQHDKVLWIRQENGGKRHAQVNGLKGQEADFILTVDSDSVVDKYALEHALRAMSDKRIQATTATCLVKNWHHGFLTRLTDLEVVNGNMIMRVARSVLGVVVPTSGPFALYRAPVIFDNVDDYVTSGTYSDDRRLTHYALLRGQVVVVEEAIVHMEMPTTMQGIFKQRTRWFQGYFKYFDWEVKNLRGWALFLRLWNVLMIAMLIPLILWTLIIAPIFFGEVYWHGWAFWFGMLYIINMHYLFKRPLMSGQQRLSIWFMSACLIMFQFWLLRPAMYFSLFKLKSAAWGTREK